MTTFDIRIVSSYSGLVVCSALDVASGRRQDRVPKYIGTSDSEKPWNQTGVPYSV